MPKQRPNRKTNEQLLDKLFHAGGNIAFLDAEFNAGMDWRRQESVTEVISIGLVICSPDFRKLDEYYSLVNPKSQRQIFPVVTEMTGITLGMLKGQPGFATVSDQITSLIRKYEVERIFTWGNADQHSLLKEKQNMRAHRVVSNDHLENWKYIDLCTDISGPVSSILLGIRGGLAINVENLMFVCGIEDKQDHNALSDAVYLYRCMQYLSTQYPPSLSDADFRQRKNIVSDFYMDRSTYNSFRRLKASSRGNDLYGEWGNVDETDMRIRALMDDIRFLKGEIGYDEEFESIQEYFAKKLANSGNN